MSVGQAQTVVLPSYSDPNSLYVTMSDPVSQGTSSLPVFATFATPILSCNPTLFSQVGTYTFSVTLSNAYISNVYTFTVTVNNFPPVFGSASSTTISVIITQTGVFNLPSYSDPDGNSMTLTTVESGQTSLPSFVAFNIGTNSFSIFPTTSS